MNFTAEIMDEKIKREVAFVLDENHQITPQSKKDEELLIKAWNINDDILSEFVNFINESMKDNDAKISLLTNTKEYVFVDSEELYDMSAFKTDETKQDKIEKCFDKIFEKVIFGYEGVFLVKKSNLA